MTLKLWLKENGKTYDWLAEKLGVTRGAVSHIARGRNSPSLPVAVKIEDLTGGKVTVRDLLPDYTPPAPLEKEEEVLV